MKIIADKKDIPKWFFEKNRYSWLKDASIEHLAYEWDIRRIADTEYDQAGLENADTSWVEMVFAKPREFKSEARNEYTHHSTEHVRCLRTADLIWMTFDQSRLMESYDELIYTSYKPATEGVVMELLLDEVSDSEIIKTLKVLLPNIRKKLGKPGPKSKEPGALDIFN
jgi:hypothetical protein